MEARRIKNQQVLVLAAVDLSDKVLPPDFQDQVKSPRAQTYFIKFIPTKKTLYLLWIFPLLCSGAYLATHNQINKPKTEMHALAKEDDEELH